MQRRTPSYALDNAELKNPSRTLRLRPEVAAGESPELPASLSGCAAILTVANLFKITRREPSK
jgi:hypothetical protein